MTQWVRTLRNALSRGIFPHQASFVLDLFLRKLLLSPQKLATRLPLSAATRVLEVGAGSGFYSLEVARRMSSGQLELFDIQGEMLKKTRQKVEGKSLSRVGYTLGDACKLPFGPNSFDLIYLITVLGEVGDAPAFLREAHRVSKPGGILSISEHLPDPDFSRFEHVKSLVEDEGFELVARHGPWWTYTANFKKREGSSERCIIPPRH